MLCLGCPFFNLRFCYHLSSVFLLFIAYCLFFFFFCKHKPTYELRISDGSSDVCSSDLAASVIRRHPATPAPCGKGLAATSVTATADPGLLHGAWAVQPQRPALLGMRSLRWRGGKRPNPEVPSIPLCSPAGRQTISWTP